MEFWGLCPLLNVRPERRRVPILRPHPPGGTTSSRLYTKPSRILFTAIVVLLLCAETVSAGDYTGGKPVITVQSGNVTGDLWMDISPAPDWGLHNIYKDFTLPEKAVGNITWARLYVSFYAYNMQSEFANTYCTNRWDGDGDGSFDGTYDRTWEENGHAPYIYIENGGNDNSGFPGHRPNESYKMINDHEIRVTSDYLMWYDVADLIRNRTVRLNVNTDGVPAPIDGRIKVTSLLVAYNDPDSDTLTHYWVNEGCDQLSYYTESVYDTVDIGDTTFYTNGAGPVTSSKLTIDYMASNNGYYGFPTADNDFYVIEPPPPNPPPVAGEGFTFPLDRDPDIQGSYSGVDSWDVTSTMQSAVSLKRPVTLGYARYFPATGTAMFYKMFLALLVTKGPLAPAADFTASATAGPAPLNVTFTDTSKGGIPAYWYWDFDNNGVIDNTTQNPVYTFTTPGTYSVRLVTSNAGGADETLKTGFITVAPPAAPPITRLDATPLSGTAPLSVQFTDASLNTPTEWNWSFGDGNFSTLQSPSHTYAFAGSFTVALNATNIAGSNTTVKSGYVTVNTASGSPVAEFSGTPLSGTAPLTVLFTDASTNSPTSRVWDFGDGNSTWNTTATTFAHTYVTAGSYTVKLTAGNAQGSDDEAKSNYIMATSGSGSTTLSLSPRIQSFSAGETREYQILADSLPRGIAGYDMDVTLTNASVAEIAGATYPPWAQISKDPLVPNSTVRLSAVDNKQQVGPGASNIVLANITIRGLSDGMTPIGMVPGEISADGGGLPITLSAVNNGTAIIGSYARPVAAFSANTTTGNVPLTVLLTDQSTGSPTSWAWDFDNDGGIDSRDQNPLVTYTTSGTFTVSLNATNDAGSDTLVKPDYISVNVGASPTPPVAAFSGTPTSGTVPFTVLFTDTSAGDPTSRVWDFGDANSTWSTTATTFAHTYAAAGSYTVNLTVANDGGSDEESKTGYITVTDASTGPVAAFSASPTSGTVSLLVTFTDKSTGDPWFWKWDFGDGSTISISKNPTHTYTTAGTYTASLKVSADGSTWSSAATKTITVNTASGVPGASFTVSATSGTVPLTVSFTDTSSGTPTSWKWDFDNDGTTDSTSQNPSHEYTETGTFTAKLTATNDVGDGTATKTITVTASSTPPDLTVENIIPNFVAGGTAGGSVFALEQNPVTIKIKNGGTGSSAATTVKLISSDGFSGTASVPTLAAGADTTVAVTDTTSRSSESSITYTATADYENKVAESSESNNAKTSSFSVVYNGYKGKRYWSGMSGGGDITTKYTYDIKGGLLYSRGDSEYTSGSFGADGWLTHTVTWQDSDLSLPSGATVKKAFLYVPYTWDNEHIVDTHTTVDFNGERISRSSWYWDQSNFGSYTNYAYGLSTYDVTSQFKKDETNIAVFTRSNPNYDDPAQAAIYTKLSMYEFFLVVIYEDSTASRQQIFLNEGFDLLGASLGYGTTPSESVANVPFTGMTIETGDMEKATLITFVPSGDSNEGNLLYNGNSIANDVWSWGGSGTGANGGHQVAEDIREVTSKIQSTGNTFGIQSTVVGPDSATPCMCAAQQFLIIDYGGGTSQSSYSSGSTTTDSSSNKEVVSSLSSQSGAATSSPARTAAQSSPESPSSTAPDTGSVRTMLAPSAPTSEEILDNPPPGPVTGDSDGDFHPVALMGGIALIGATGALAYQRGWLPNGNGGNGSFRPQRVLCHDGSGTCPPISLNILSGTVSTPPNGGTGHPSPFSRLHPPGGSWRLVAGLIVAAGVIGAGAFFGMPAFSGAGTAGTGTTGTPFSLLPTVEKIADLDTTNHAPDYPAGFSARNGILFVYSGADDIPVSEIELRLSKGSNEVFITATSRPPVKNAVNPELSSYFEEMGNGDGTLSSGEWLMVYADNCYDSSLSDGNPRGQVLIWEPENSRQRVEVPVKDTIGYTLTDKSSGTALQQGTLSFIPP